MTELAKMDVFFFITTLVVIAIGIALAFVLFRIWRILGHVEDISRDVSEESALMRGDIAVWRDRVRTEGFKMLHMTNFFTQVGKHFSGLSKRSRTTRDKKE
jgi:hypothetical protein